VFLKTLYVSRDAIVKGQRYDRPSSAGHSGPDRWTLEPSGVGEEDTSLTARGACCRPITDPVPEGIP
jgi:hypothetical protein